jgi:hypothetical protein
LRALRAGQLQETELALRDFGPRCQQNIAPDQVKQDAEDEKRYQGEKIGIVAVKNGLCAFCQSSIQWPMAAREPTNSFTAITIPVIAPPAM